MLTKLHTGAQESYAETSEKWLLGRKRPTSRSLLDVGSFTLQPGLEESLLESSVGQPESPAIRARCHVS